MRNLLENMGSHKIGIPCFCLVLFYFFNFFDASILCPDAVRTLGEKTVPFPHHLKLLLSAFIKIEDIVAGSI